MVFRLQRIKPRMCVGDVNRGGKVKKEKGVLMQTVKTAPASADNEVTITISPQSRFKKQKDLFFFQFPII